MQLFMIFAYIEISAPSQVNVNFFFFFLVNTIWNDMKMRGLVKSKLSSNNLCVFYTHYTILKYLYSLSFWFIAFCYSVFLSFIFKKFTVAFSSILQDHYLT